MGNSQSRTKKQASEEDNELTEFLKANNMEEASDEQVASDAHEFFKFLKKNKDLTATQIYKELTRWLDNWKTVTLKIGVIGGTGVGKSTFINTFRGVSTLDPGSATTGVTETTMIAKMYLHPKYENVEIWDLPGSGTPNFPVKAYCKKIGLESFDFFIIVSASRFTESDLLFAKEIRKVGKKFYFLRSKIDFDVSNDKLYDNPTTHSEEEVLKRIRNNCLTQLKQAEFIEPHVFLVCRDPRLYDYPEFEAMAISDLPALKRELLLTAAKSHSFKIFSMKTSLLKRRVWLWAAVSGAAGIAGPFVQLFNYDSKIILNELVHYMEVYELDDKALQTLRDAGKDVENVLAEIMKKHGLATKGIGAMNAVIGVGSSFILMSLKNGLWFAPLVGVGVSAVVSFTTTAVFLSKIRLILEEASHELYSDVFSDHAFKEKNQSNQSTCCDKTVST